MIGLGSLGKRLVEGIVGLFALLGFFYVPLGHHTGFEHVRAVLSTPAARSAFEDLSSAALDLRARAVSLITGHQPGEPAADAAETARGPREPHQPRPVPPRLK